MNSTARARTGRSLAARVRPGRALAARAMASLVVVAGTLGASVASAQLAIVLNSRDASMSLIDQKTFAEVGRLDVGKEPHHLYPKPDGKSLIVANAMSNDLHVPRSGRRQASAPDPRHRRSVPDRLLARQTAGSSRSALRLDRVDLYRYDGRDITLARRIPLGKAPSHVWFSADSRFAFVTLQESDEIAAIDLAAPGAGVEDEGRQAAGRHHRHARRPPAAGRRHGRRLRRGDRLARAQKTVARIRTGKGAHNFRGLGDGRHVFVSNRVENTISQAST